MPRRSTNPVGTLAKASMGVITRLERRNRELLAALKKIAVVQHVRLAVNGGDIPNGWSCQVCRAECDADEHLEHKHDCPLVGEELTK
jgi:hypothetical protein